MPGEYWTTEQIHSLLRQVVIEQRPLPQLHVPGKSMAAINNQRRRLKEAGALQDAFLGRKLVPWTICELRQLVKLTCEYGFSAAFIAQLQLIPGRSQYAISKMMGRHGLGDPAVKARAQTAQRLNQEQRRELERFLRHEGRFCSSAQVACQWGLAEQTVNAYRRRLGVPLSWQEARASDEHRRYEEMHRRGFQERLSKRWEEWRNRREQRLRALRARLEGSPDAPARRLCESCGEQWFATRDFFHVAARQRSNAKRFSMSRTCRICRSAQRRARRMSEYEPRSYTIAA
jgi:DNA-binding CsgD family transcriptional regulator